MGVHMRATHPKCASLFVIFYHVDAKKNSEVLLDGRRPRAPESGPRVLWACRPQCRTQMRGAHEMYAPDGRAFLRVG